jgi:N6-L-threonylcarbamoyladenine synthase
MIILGIETSCDETSAAIIEKHQDKIILKSNIVASSLSLHKKTGGIIPENAAREQIKFILPVIKEALKSADTNLENVDTVAVTYGPGLIGSLLVGVETAKTLAFVLNKPIIPINHMIGHIYANWLSTAEIEFPALALVVSGGHTDLLLMKSHGDFKLLGGTRDDAAGEAFDKIGRLLGFSYPAGPMIEEKAKLGDVKRFNFPRPLIGSDDYDFSFSGLKTAVLREVIKLKENKSLTPKITNDICAAIQQAIISVLIKKTLKAAKEHNVKSILLSGGVAANRTLKETFEQMTKDQLPKTKLFVPTKSLCTDNGAMIAAAAAYNYHPIPWEKITANPQLYFD